MEKIINLKWLYLDFNSYFATIEQQVNPGLRNIPIAIVPSITDYTCAIAASYEAKRLGIKTGTIIHEAKKCVLNWYVYRQIMKNIYIITIN